MSGMASVIALRSSTADGGEAIAAIVATSLRAKQATRIHVRKPPAPSLACAHQR